MGELCKQEAHIAELKADRNNINKTLEQLLAGQTEFISVLRDISKQGEQIKSLIQRSDKTEKDVEELYKRMRGVELDPGKQASTMQTSIITVIIAAVVAYFYRKIGG